jgi:hypothetical protein
LFGLSTHVFDQFCVLLKVLPFGKLLRNAVCFLIFCSIAEKSREQVFAARFMEQIGLLCDNRFAALALEPGGKELISYHYPHSFADNNAFLLQGKPPARMGFDLHTLTLWNSHLHSLLALLSPCLF